MTKLATAAADATAATSASTEAASTAASATSDTAAADAAAAAAAAAATTAATDATKAAEGATKPAEGATKPAESATAASATVPETYDLKLPDGSTFQPDFVTRTADIARALGLTNEGGQKLLDAQIAEITQSTSTAVDAAKAEQLEAMKPGGAVWKEQEAQWRTNALADAELGGSPEKLQANIDLALKVVNKFATDDTKKFFTDTGLGSHPELVRVFARIGKQMAEATLKTSINGGATGALTEDEKLAKRYPTMVAKS